MSAACAGLPDRLRSGAADVAAMIPAGPPPTTTMSNSPYIGVCLLGSVMLALLTGRLMG